MRNRIPSRPEHPRRSKFRKGQRSTQRPPQKPFACWEIHPDQKAEIERRAQEDGERIGWTLDALLHYALTHCPAGFA
jgi:hypothetical protein